MWLEPLGTNTERLRDGRGRMGLVFLESVLSELIASIVLSTLGLLFARSVAFAFKWRIYRTFYHPKSCRASSFMMKHL